MKRVIATGLGLLLAALILLPTAGPAAENPPVDINAASVAQLATIKGIGPAKAQAIVEHREANGQFKSVEDLKMVKGIGDKMLEQLRPHVTVGAKPGGAATKQ